MREWKDLSPTEKQEVRRLQEKIQQFFRTEEKEHQEKVREMLDTQHARRPAHGRVPNGNAANERFTHGPNRCSEIGADGRPCKNRALANSDRCYEHDAD